MGRREHAKSHVHPVLMQLMTLGQGNEVDTVGGGKEYRRGRGTEREGMSLVKLNKKEIERKRYRGSKKGHRMDAEEGRGEGII